MPKYPVLDNLSHDKKRYKAGDTVELSEEAARQLQGTSPPVIGPAQDEANANGEDDPQAQDAGGGEDLAAQDVPGEAQTSKPADAPAKKPKPPKSP